MSLPGGLAIDGELHRDFRFRPVTGELELMMGESADYAQNHAARITSVLCQALETLGGGPPSHETVRCLSVGDRQFLVVQLAAHTNNAPVWLTAYCGACQEPFDVSYRHSELPVKPAGEGYPKSRVNTSLGPLDVRVPTGADQEQIALAGTDAEAISMLLNFLVLSDNLGPEFDPAALSEEDVAAIEERVEDMSPEIATELLAACAECGAENKIPINLYTCLESSMDELFSEVHTIASRYYWSEDAILQLPRYRRQAYLRFIDLSRGMHRPADFIRAS